MKKIFIGLVFLLGMSNPLWAASQDEEIAHLLDFVAASGCTFDRNGTQHDSVEAKEHMQLNYNHIKSRIKSTEDFIRYAATKSSMSGKKYHATCDGKTITSQEWLTTELQRYRQQHP